VSRTTRRHESLGKMKRRGPKNKIEDDMPKGVRKPPAQSRRGDKQKLRKEWL